MRLIWTKTVTYLLLPKPHFLAFIKRVSAIVCTRDWIDHGRYVPVYISAMTNIAFGLSGSGEMGSWLVGRPIDWSVSSVEIITIIINLFHIAQFDTNGILTALYIVIKYIQPHHMHLCMDIHEHLQTLKRAHWPVFLQWKGIKERRFW